MDFLLSSFLELGSVLVVGLASLQARALPLGTLACPPACLPACLGESETERGFNAGICFRSEKGSAHMQFRRGSLEVF